MPGDPSAPIWHVHRPHLAAVLLDDGDLPSLIDGDTIVQERRGLSPTSITKRRTLLRRVAFWMAPRGLLEATEDDIELYLGSRPLSAKSRHGYTSELHAFSCGPYGRAWSTRIRPPRSSGRGCRGPCRGRSPTAT